VTAEPVQSAYGIGAPLSFRPVGGGLRVGARPGWVRATRRGAEPDPSTDAPLSYIVRNGTQLHERGEAAAEDRAEWDVAGRSVRDSGRQDAPEYHSSPVADRSFPRIRRHRRQRVDDPVLRVATTREHRRQRPIQPSPLEARPAVRSEDGRWVSTERRGKATRTNGSHGHRRTRRRDLRRSGDGLPRCVAPQ
jgi:hypothetical protein